METLQELRKRRAELIASKKMRSNIFKEQTERQKLKKDIRELKYPKTLKTARAFKEFGGAGLKRLGRGTEKIIKKQYQIGARMKK